MVQVQLVISSFIVMSFLKKLTKDFDGMMGDDKKNGGSGYPGTWVPFAILPLYTGVHA